MALANVVEEAQEPSSLILNEASSDEIDLRFTELESKVVERLSKQGFASSDIELQLFLNLRYSGTDTQIMVQKPADGNFRYAFEESHKREFTFKHPNRDIVIDDTRIRGIGIGKGRNQPSAHIAQELKTLVRKPVKDIGKITQAYFKVGGRQDTRVLSLSELRPGNTVVGPAIIIDKTQTIVIVPGATGLILKDQVILYVAQQRENVTMDAMFLSSPDPIKLSTFGHRKFFTGRLLCSFADHLAGFMSIAEQMGRTLQKTAVSINIKERYFSTTLYLHS